MLTVQANVEYFFRLIYECFHGGCGTSIDTTQFLAWLTHLWLWVIIIGYALAVAALISIVYTTVRLFELRKREDEFYSKMIPMPGSETGPHPRWEHIRALAEGSTPSEWREAIIEADIMLDETLSSRGYVGAGVGEKLKTADRSRFGTLDDAWEAHKVRNQIAHQGSTFELTESLVRRTIARYESVFRELNII